MQQLVANRDLGGQLGTMRIDLVRPDWATLENEWRTLERTADGSFFQSWTWVGCRARERFTDPWLLRATESGAVVGLALLNRTGPVFARTLRLHETGRRAEDGVFIEHNAPLLARGRQALLAPMLATALRHGRLILSGVDDRVLQAAQMVGSCQIVTSRAAPFAALGDVTADQWLAGLSASTRYKLRRSLRHYEAAGALTLQRAEDVAEGLAFLGELVTLHQRRWTARGQPGAFAEPAVMAFHRELVARGLPRGEVELLRLRTVAPSGVATLGYLYNFRWCDRIFAYQGGFDYAAADPHQAPGLTSHHAAIKAAISDNVKVYDLLAGDARYKTSLGNGQVCLHWLALTRASTPYDLLHRVQSLRVATPIRKISESLRSRILEFWRRSTGRSR